MQNDETTRLSTTGGALMRGGHWLEGWSVTQNLRALSSSEAQFHSQGTGAALGLLMKHTCHEAGEPKKTHYFTATQLQAAVWPKDWELKNVVTLRSSGCGFIRPWMRRRLRQNTFRPREERCDERQDKETDEPDGNENCCWRECLSGRLRESRRRRCLRL